MLTPEVQQKLISENINSAICIDNEYVEAYTDGGDGRRDESRQLYESFRDSGLCHLDIYHFTNIEAYHQNKERLLRNRDLVILDWELDDNKLCKYEDALAILDDVCQNDQIHFVDIYTQAKDNTEIAHTIYSYFKLQQREELLPQVEGIVDVVADLIDGFSLEGFDSDVAKKIIEEQLGSFIMNPSRRSEIVKGIKKAIFQAIENAGGDKVIKQSLCDELRSNFDENADIKTHYDLYRAYCICYLCTSPIVSGSGLSAKAINPSTIFVKGTVIHVTSKSEVNPNGLFEAYSQAVVNIPRHRSLLLSLLLKQLITRNLATVGKEIGGISETSLLAHCNELRKVGVAEENIGHFVVSALTEHICSVFQNSESASILNQLIDVKTEVSPELSLEEEHIKLNSLLTFLPKEKMMASKHQIKPGDVFVLDKVINDTEKKSKHAYQYMLCVTQSCDALRPFKVNNNLAFVLGEIAGSAEEVVNAETDYHTFLPEKKIIIWTNKFFTIFVKDTILSLAPDECKFTFHYIDGNFTATFLGTQKEAYTYRIINNVFSNAMRIGIDLPHK